AIILFEANIRHAHDGAEGTRATLDESMAILIECHTSDKRKQYHAVRFGDQAVRYWNAYRDDKARGYLATAREWLQEEADDAPWSRSVRRMLERVARLSQV